MRMQPTHNIGFVMAHINHHQELGRGIYPYILDSFINANAVEPLALPPTASRPSPGITLQLKPLKRSHQAPPQNRHRILFHHPQPQSMRLISVVSSDASTQRSVCFKVRLNLMLITFNVLTRKLKEDQPRRLTKIPLNALRKRCH